MADGISGNRMAELKEHVDRCGRARIILTRCDSDAAVRFGKSLGITMFQGLYIDEQLSGDAHIVSAARHMLVKDALQDAVKQPPALKHGCSSLT